MGLTTKTLKKKLRTSANKSPTRLLIITIISASIIEALFMLLIYILSPLTRATEVILDFFLTVLIVFFVSTLWLIHPLVKQIEERKRAEQALEQARAELEQRVEARTRALAEMNRNLETEIAERKKVEEALRQEGKHLQLFLAQIPAVLWATDTKLTITSVAGAGLTVINTPSDDMVGMGLGDLVQEDLRPGLLKAHEDALQGRPNFFDYDSPHTNQSYQIFVEPFYCPEGKIIGCIGLLLNVTEQKNAESIIRLQSTALEAAANGIMITDRAGHIQWANPAFEAITGYPLDEINGQTPHFLKSGGQDNAFYQDMWATIASGKVWQGEMVNRRKDGQTYPEEQTITPVMDERGRVVNFISIKRDITTRKKADMELKQRNLELARLNEIGSAVSSSLNTASIIKTLTQFLDESLGVPAGLIFLVDRDHDRLILEAMWGLKTPGLGLPVSFALDAYPYQQIFREQKILLTGVISDHPELLAAGLPLNEFRQSAMLCIPLVAQGAIQGILELFSEQPDAFKIGDLNFYQALSNHLGSALQNANLYSAEIAAHKRTEQLRRASQALNRSLDLDAILNTLADHLGMIAAYDTANITLLEGESQLVQHVTRGDPDAYPCHILPLEFDNIEHKLIHDLLEKQESLLMHDAHAEFGWDVCPAKVCIRSWIMVPIKAKDRSLGIFSMGKAEPNSFTNDHLHLVQVLTNQAATAIQNAWLFDQVRAGHERLQSLSRRLVDLQEMERSYIARELHDETGQALTAIMLGLKAMERTAGIREAEVERLVDLEDTVEEVMENIHQVAVNLHPASLDHLGLPAALRQLMATFAEKFGVKVSFDIFGLDSRLPIEVETALYRIVQEALTNVARHAQATIVDVILENRGNTLVLIVEDNGIGFNSHVHSGTGRLGLFGMRERAEMLGGKLLVEGKPGSGVTLKVEIPWPKEGKTIMIENKDTR